MLNWAQPPSLPPLLKSLSVGENIFHMSLAEEEWWAVPFQIFRISLISAISRTLLK